jgi:hypothetical protein
MKGIRTIENTVAAKTQSKGLSNKISLSSKKVRVLLQLVCSRLRSIMANQDIARRGANITRKYKIL